MPLPELNTLQARRDHELRLSQPELATRMGRSARTVHRLETGKYDGGDGGPTVGAELLVAYAKALDWDVTETAAALRAAGNELSDAASLVAGEAA